MYSVDNEVSAATNTLSSFDRFDVSYLKIRDLQGMRHAFNFSTPETEAEAGGSL